MTTRKSLAIGVIICVLAWAIGCSQESDQSEAHVAKNAALAAVLTPTVGDPIPVDLAATWINAFRASQPQATAALTHDLPQESIVLLLEARYHNQPADGLRVVKGVRPDGQEALIVIPVLGGNDLWYTGAVYDKNGTMSVATAKQWTEAFRHAHPEGDVHRSYFVGREALEDLTGTYYTGAHADAIRFYKAQNDAGKETLVLAPVQRGATLGMLEAQLAGVAVRGNGNGDGVIYYEYSSPCPSSCAERTPGTSETQIADVAVREMGDGGVVYYEYMTPCPSTCEQ